MTYWIPVYTDNGRKQKADYSRLNQEQLNELSRMFHGVCMGLNSEFVQKLYEQCGRKNLFRYINAETGMRYQVEINKRKQSVTILSVDVDYKKMAQPGNGGIAA